MHAQGTAHYEPTNSVTLNVLELVAKGELFRGFV